MATRDFIFSFLRFLENITSGQENSSWCLDSKNINLNNIYFENNQTIQYIKHSNYIQDSETSNYVVGMNCFAAKGNFWFHDL